MMVYIDKEDPVWPKGRMEQLYGYFQRAFEEQDHQGMSLEDMRQAVIANAFTLWAVYKEHRIVGAVLTRFVRYSAKLLLEITFAGSEKGAMVWPQALEDLKSYAKAYGAEGITGTGRDGWVKALPVSRTRTVWEIDL